MPGLPSSSSKPNPLMSSCKRPERFMSQSRKHMKKFAMVLLCLLLPSPARIYAANWQSSGTSASPKSNDCEGAAKACSSAAKELKAARDLIQAYKEQIAASDERIDLALKEIEALKQIAAMQGERAAKLEGVIVAEREAKAVLVRLKADQEIRIRKLEKQLGRSHKFALVAGVAAGVAILLGAAR